MRLTMVIMAREYHKVSSFKIIMVLAGEGIIKTATGEYPYYVGDTYLIPANIKALAIESAINTKILEVYLPA